MWRSYSDMMSGLLLLFVLIMAVCLMQAQKNYAEKLKEQAKQLQTQNALNASQTQVNEQADQLASQKEQLDDQAAALSALQSQLDDQASQLDTQASQLAQQQTDLEDAQAALAQRQKDLDSAQAQIDSQSAQLAQRDKDLAASQALLDEQTTLMAEQQERIDKIIGVKADLIAALNEEFQKNQIQVQIDSETGAIVLESNVLFDFNESVLLEEGTAILSQILPIYCDVLLSDEYIDYVAEIIVDGYTDTQGDYISNLELSQNRAFAVAEYLVAISSQNMSQESVSLLLEKLTANGRSMSNPVLDANGNVDMDASRRVEVKFRLKDEEMIAQLQEMIEESGIGEAAAAGAAQQEEQGAASDDGAAA